MHKSAREADPVGTDDEFVQEFKQAAANKCLSSARKEHYAATKFFESCSKSLPHQIKDAEEVMLKARAQINRFAVSALLKRLRAARPEKGGNMRTQLQSIMGTVKSLGYERFFSPGMLEEVGELLKVVPSGE